MKAERCVHCGNVYPVIESYTLADVAEEITDHLVGVIEYNPADLLYDLVDSGYRATDIRKEITRMWDAGEIIMNKAGNWTLNKK